MVQAISAEEPLARTPRKSRDPALRLLCFPDGLPFSDPCRVCSGEHPIPISPEPSARRRPSYCWHRQPGGGEPVPPGEQAPGGAGRGPGRRQGSPGGAGRRLAGTSGGAPLLPGAAAVAGHWHPLPLRFRGGAGLATAIGVCIGALPIAAAVGLAVGVAATAGWRNVGRGAGLGWTALLGVALGLGERWYVVLGLVGLGAIILGRARLTSRGTGDTGGTL